MQTASNAAPSSASNHHREPVNPAVRAANSDPPTPPTNTTDSVRGSKEKVSGRAIYARGITHRKRLATPSPLANTLPCNAAIFRVLVVPNVAVGLNLLVLPIGAVVLKWRRLCLCSGLLLVVLNIIGLNYVEKTVASEQIFDSLVPRCARLLKRCSGIKVVLIHNVKTPPH